MPFAPVSAEEVEMRAREGTTAPNLQLAIAHAPEVARNQLTLLRSLTAGLDQKLVELVILQHAIVTENAYCWGHHVPVAVAAGYADDQLRALRDGDDSLLDERDRQIAAYVRDVLARTVTDEQFAAMRRLGDEDLVKVTMLVGQYSMVGLAQAAMDVQQDEGFGGFECP
jgi:alkylhydroperoxidase family enzyme